MRKVIFNEFGEDIAKEFEKQVQLHAARAKKAQNFCQFCSSSFLLEITYLFRKI